MDNANSPAMPITDERGMPFNDLPSEVCTTGLTKREYFAVRAMQAWMTGCLSWTDGLNGGEAGIDPHNTAKIAVDYADALLEKLEENL